MTGAPSAYTEGITLAPMAGYTDSAFRRICRRFGATACVTEMVAAAGISRRSRGSRKMMRFDPEEKPIGLQLFGSRPGDFARAAGSVSELGFDFLDINAGCPVRKVVSGGSGCALLRDVPLLVEIVRAAVAETPLPVTVKLRLGWSPAEPLPADLPGALAEAGAAALAVHARYRTDMFAGEPRTSELAAMASSSPIPLIASGESRSVGSALSFLAGSGASGLMAGRGALGAPWLFRGLVSGDPEDARPRRGELLSTVSDQLDMMMEYIPEGYVFHIIRGHLVFYLRGFRGASGLRGRAVTVESRAEVVDLVAQADRMISEERDE